MSSPLVSVRKETEYTLWVGTWSKYICFRNDDVMVGDDDVMVGDDDVLVDGDA